MKAPDTSEGKVDISEDKVEVGTLFSGTAATVSLSDSDDEAPLSHVKQEGQRADEALVPDFIWLGAFKRGYEIRTRRTRIGEP